jgi:hypothetical protein
MIWKPTSLLEFNSETKEWSKRRFEKFQEYYHFVKSCFKLPGEYNFKNTKYWREPSLQYLKNGRYCNYHHTSKEYKEYWLLERRKCQQGLIVDGVFIPGSFYFFLNFTPIFNKLESRETFADLFDGQYHLALYIDLCVLEDKDAAGTKCRQRGISLYLMSYITREVWFGKKTTCKIVGSEEEYILLEWAIMEGYRDWLNSNTGWYRPFSPNESLNWEQKVEVKEGTLTKKIFHKGNKTKVKGGTTKKNVAKAVGGSAKIIYATEAGIYPNLKKVQGYVKDNLKMGGVKTGIFIAFGAVGEMRDAADLQDFCFNPNAYNIKSVKDVFSDTMDDIAFFYPDFWNYTYKDETTGEVIKCYDEDGNSDIELAKKFLLIEEAKARQAGESDFKLYKSQHPSTLQDAFDQREDNPFPTHLLKEQEFQLLNKKQIIIRLKPDPKGTGKLIHEFCDHVPISKLNPNPNEDNSGAIVVKEFPIDNPPFGLYYAGVDPIYNKDTSTSRSLMCIRIWIGTHERDGKIIEPYPVAHYIGRHKNVRDTYQVCLDLIKWYNARTAVESNVKDFIEWVIKQGDSRFLMRRRELTAINEMSPDSTIRDEIGVYMEGKFKDRALEKYITWLQTPIGASFDLQTGESKEVYNTGKLDDLMLIKECLRFNYKRNSDRLVAEMLALIAAQTDTNRHIITSVKNPFKESPKNVSMKMGSAFRPRTGVSSTLKKMPSPFGKR